MIPPFDIIVILYEIISLIIYLSIVIFFTTQYTKHDKDGMNAFYTTFIIGFFVDTFEIAKSKFIVSIPSFGYFIEFYQTSPIPKYGIPIFGYTVTFATALGIFCITLNRNIATSFPMFYHLKWSKYTLLITFIIQIFLPLLVFHYEFGAEAKLKLDSDTGKYAFGMKDAEISKKNNTIAPIFSTIILILQVAFNALSIYKLCCVNAKTRTTLEFKILYSSIIYSSVATIGVSIICLRYWIKFAGIYNDSAALRDSGQMLGTYSSTIATTCQPYLMLAINANVRKNYLMFILRRKKVQPCKSVFGIKTTLITTKRTNI
uniref:7TM_GPCR_Srx domain-containing protein n=1 Tax=Parastrongyloides trichosuri TaxID=131310 RepID=A0A0N4ZDN3_PARTI